MDTTRLPFHVASRPATRPTEAECEVIALFDEFRNSLLRYSLSLGLSVNDGEEITQEVFLALLRHLQLGRSRKNLRGWIFRVAHNLALKQRYASQRLGSETAPDTFTIENRSDPSPNPEERALDAQRRRNLLSVVGALAERDRSCLSLRAEGLRYREIAEVTGMSLGAVSISLTRSLERLTVAYER